MGNVSVGEKLHSNRQKELSTIIIICTHTLLFYIDYHQRGCCQSYPKFHGNRIHICFG